MTNKIAIIDFLNQDMGLKILFPEADYFILEEEFDRTKLYFKYNISPIVHNKDVNVYEFITSDNYDTLLIIGPLYDALKKYNNLPKSYSLITYQKLMDVLAFINKNNFKNVCFFDNYDYDYDPNIVIEQDNILTKNVKVFKRYYNKNKPYKINVNPFPYITFGHECNLDILNNFEKNIGSLNNKIPRIFFAGSPVVHIDETYGIVRNRKEILLKIMGKINLYIPGYLPNDAFIAEMKNSKYSLDLLGVGDPNTRTYEILSCGSLILGQRSNLKWDFEEEFCEETIFDNENDLLEKLIRLENEEGLYEKCLEQQNKIVRTYMNMYSLRKYIIDRL